ncbi:MAG: holo-[acyl-carrier-protein] synthase [Candidatus Schekmanbacteria bacterium RIFCSPHIGHO2_02_FULL_38_11]|uniref:Holo-[acyl-carrier-protein] synthase n=1 Tax=Candidatus Schekmanbacteria bacterium RIFCSPLOWO2_12_FULL_38_15 TaxID=1817883 RepID=A0A1F7SHX8_9BACT|nr:MAG: holo-[acyl-carrier-protein] synthase [Candidatus Schekmanbacteria bacterium GWA2_38_9]OGL50909.1 MAG: holo-[acyl-carrier-protein] synthase [Candidatus Schekmanbacteria bacterium RIFCSPLOWO2_02_FULL_38_14]OGL53331.1 MAG: holo-[acyl-carrier-protein] synthase [Candidatus Schekmanbacteria bacterium RIFCSPLOWO2_12_FULL_38_15]OGL54784.1 MAG: holo-[acyl-carrier-protein] synthase [Candidatus Schekmanbacteria bacterium RIFCSPHIGHO2_02_FULL_38_11]
MIIGIGVDHIEISRIKKTIRRQKERFLNKIFTEKEIEYCEKKKDRYQHYAARFAAKEAVYKALNQTGTEGISWKDIEIVNEISGKPEIFLRNKTLRLAKRLKVSKILLSISHNKDIAISNVIITS